MRTAAVRYLVRRMSVRDIPQVMEVERESFPSMWPPTAFKRELQQNRLARYLVVVERRDDEPEPGPEPEPATPETRRQGGDAYQHRGPLGRLFGELRHMLGSDEDGELPPAEARPELVVGVMGVWLLPDEAHIVTVAVRDSHRRRGIGELLVICAIELAQANRQDVVTLECRASNTAALALYGKYDFKQVGLRPNYYSDNREDALILTADAVTSPRYARTLQRLKQEHQRRWGHYALLL